MLMCWRYQPATISLWSDWLSCWKQAQQGGMWSEDGELFLCQCLLQHTMSVVKWCSVTVVVLVYSAVDQADPLGDIRSAQVNSLTDR